MASKTQPIGGVFDSGVGGISVLRNLHRLMPQEDYLFYGDSANAPYGVKTVAQVQQLSRAIVEKFIAQNVKAIVIACNTATSAAIDKLRAQYPQLPIVGLEPAVKPAVMRKPHSRVLVMATPLTLREQKFQELMQQYDKLAELIPVPAPRLVEFVEAGELDSPAVEAYLTELLQQYRGQVDAIVLGCTHFPFAEPAIIKVMGPAPFIIDGGPGAARELQRLLREKELLEPLGHPGSVSFANSEPGAAKLELSKRLFAESGR
nr:glutamate racemase [Liquorilactobacillus satsumensis]